MARPREFDKDDVIEKAMFLFWQQGYEVTSVRDLTKATGMSSSSMYEVFGDKRGIFLAALARFCEIEKANIAQMAVDATTPHAFIETLFGSIPSLHAPDTIGKGSLSFNTMVEFGVRDMAVTELLLTHYFGIGELIAQVLEQGQRNGIVTNKLPAQDLALTILTTLQGLATISGVKPDATSASNVVQVLLHLMTP